MYHIKFGSNLCTKKGQMEKYLQGDYEANCEKMVQSGNVRETITMIKWTEMLEHLELSGSML